MYKRQVVYSCAFVIVQLVLLWTHASACLQGSAQLEWRKLLTNVNLIAIAAGALLYLLHISLPAPITSTLSSVGNMIGPMGMLLAGMAIAEVPLKKVFCTPRNYLPVFLRLLGVPLVIVLLLWAVQASHWVPDGKSILMTVYLSAITPACATVTDVYKRQATPSAILNISVVAEEDCEILLLNVKRLLTSCTTACDHHQKLIRNLVSVLANKILLFNDKITHVSKRTTREKLLSYLSAESIRQSSLSFDIPFDRQQLADFLCVERAAMSVELSKLQKEGLLVTKRNHFELLTR